MITSNLSNGEGTITLTPNCSASWEVNKLLIMVLGGLTMVTAFFWAMVGAWVIFPFAGLEVGLLAFFLHRVCCATHSRQVLFIESGRLRLESGLYRPISSRTFSRQRAFILVIPASHELATQSIYLCDAASQVELGVFLNKNDKAQFIKLIGGTGFSVRNRPPYNETRIAA